MYICNECIEDCGAVRFQAAREDRPDRFKTNILCIYVYIYIYICVIISHVYICIYIYIYIYTYYLSPLSDGSSDKASLHRRPYSQYTHDFNSQNFKLRASNTGTAASAHFKMPFESSNLPGSGSTFPE